MSDQPSTEKPGLSPKQIHAFKVFAQARKMAKDDCLVEAYEIWEYQKALAREQNDEELLALLKEQEARFDKLFLE